MKRRLSSTRTNESPDDDDHTLGGHGLPSTEHLGDLGAEQTARGGTDGKESDDEALNPSVECAGGNVVWIRACTKLRQKEGDISTILSPSTGSPLDGNGERTRLIKSGMTSRPEI